MEEELDPDPSFVGIGSHHYRVLVFLATQRSILYSKCLKLLPWGKVTPSSLAYEVGQARD